MPPRSRPSGDRATAVIVADIMRTLCPETVTDFGCGGGAWLAEFARYGCEIQGVDQAPGQELLIPAACFVERDLARDQDPLLPATDLALCLGTADRLPAHRADWLVDVLCGTSRVVLFSTTRVGEDQDFWHDLFELRRYEGTSVIRWRNRHPENLFLYAESEWIDNNERLVQFWDEADTVPDWRARR